ncbi:MAG: hypothetical protein IJ237_08950 [Oscillospiraceae bacterium]|nr:hypothetical protein [Oscillospiraceae bacterium]
MELSVQAKPEVEKIFLIDFENVHEKGLEGISRLRPIDTVHLFYTKNASKISLDILSEIQAKLCFHKVNVGKQSLDMQLVSYLGFLIGTVGKEPEYVIVSNDAGFHNTLAFWGEKDTKISQMKSMTFEKTEDAHPQQSAVRSSASAKPASAPRSPYRMRAAQANSGSQSSASVSHNSAEKAIPQKAAESSAVPAAPTAPAPAAAPSLSTPAASTSAAAVQTEEAPAVPVVQPQEATNSHPVRGATEKTQMNNKITVALRDRKVESEKIGKATATVMKLYGSRNFRQAAYREMIKLFGQKEGLELYNIIRPILPAAVPVQKKASARKTTAKTTAAPTGVETPDSAAGEAVSDHSTD